jgi:HAE1 family hydrophobic/amphiphilic exporter-1
MVLSGLAVILIIPQELFPSVTFPQLTIVTPYPNAAPEEIENLVTKLVEESISTVKNLKTMRSYSREGISLVIAEFNWGTDMNFASLNLREKIDLVKERLPRDAEEPLVLKFNPFSKPIMVFSLVSRGDPDDPTTLKMHEILKISKERIKDKLEKVPGVASVTISGGQEREVHVDLDLDQLLSHKINILDVPPALKDSNLNYPAGSVKEEFFEYLVRTMGEYQTIQDIEQTLVSIENIKKGKYDRMRRKEERRSGERSEQKDVEDRSSQFVLLRDVAQVTDGFRERSSHSRYIGKPNISLSIQKQASANIIATVKRVKEELHRIRTETNIIPKGLEMTLIYDESVFIKTAINGVVKAALMGGCLAFFVLLFFLGSFKSSLIVAASIPVSVLAALIAMWFFDVTLNMMSLGGLALGIGMLVDNAIVVVENIERHRSMKKPLDEAAISGGQEVFGAIFSSTLTTIAVFFPLAFVYGIAGELFKPISFTIVFSLVASLITAVTLIPRLTIIKIGRGTAFREPGPVMMWFQNFFGNLLNRFLNFSYPALFFGLMLFLSSLALMATFETEIMPKVDQGQFNVKISMPTGTVLVRTNEVASIVEETLLKNENVESISVAVGSDKSAGKASLNSLGAHEAQIIVKLKKERTRNTHAVMQTVQDEIEHKRRTMDSVSLKSAEIVFTPEDNPFAGAFENQAPVAINVTGRDLGKLQKMVQEVEKLLGGVRGVYNVRNDIPSKSPEYRIIPNRKRAAMNGISASDIAQTALIALRGTIATKLKKEGNETGVLVRLQKADRQTQEALRNIPLFVEDSIIPLKDVAQITSGRGPSEIKRLDQVRIFHVYADIRDRTPGEVFREIESLLKQKETEENYFIGFGQEYEDRKKSTFSMFMVFILSVVLVYMIMAAQFESLWQPFIIMMTVPLSVIGVSMSLYLTGITLNAMSMLGLIMLAGIVVNNGIVLIQFINDLREEGYPLREAIITGAKTRLRPILMTTATTLLGLMPLALKLEEGSEFQQPMAIAVIGGLLVSTCLTLFIIPAFYIVSESLIVSIKKRRLLG